MSKGGSRYWTWAPGDTFGLREHQHNVKLRELPGALALGIPVAILAHTVLFQDGHQLGGPLQGVFLGAAVAASVGVVVLFAALALVSAKTAATTGSLLAARLSAWLPGAWLLAATALGWYIAIECSETDGHAPAPFFAMAIALVACALAIRWAAQFVLGAIASVTLAAHVRPFAGRPRAFAPRRPEPILAAAGRVAAYRRFARPPPHAMPCA